MKTQIRILTLILIGLIVSGSSLYSQEKKQKETKEGYQFSIEINLPTTPVKDQHRTSTCWSFAATSFLESELLRIGKGTYDLSEMYFVRKAYELKSEKGLSTDIIRAISEHKKEPSWMLDYRLQSYAYFKSKKMPKWGPSLQNLNFDDLYYYIQPTKKAPRVTYFFVSVFMAPY